DYTQAHLGPRKPWKYAEFSATCVSGLQFPQASIVGLRNLLATSMKRSRSVVVPLMNEPAHVLVPSDCGHHSKSPCPPLLARERVGGNFGSRQQRSYWLHLPDGEKPSSIILSTHESGIFSGLCL